MAGTFRSLLAWPKWLIVIGSLSVECLLPGSADGAAPVTADDQSPPGADRPEDGREPVANRPRDPEQELAAVRELSTVFAAIDPVSVKDRRWVVVDTGPVGWKMIEEGWLVEEKADAIRVLSPWGVSRWLRKPRPGEQQPKVKEGEGIAGSDLQSDKFEAVWQIRTGDFHDLCRQRLKKGIPEEEEIPEGVVTFDQGRGHFAGITVETARYAVWAEQVDERQLALDLAALAARAHDMYSRRYSDAPSELPQFVADRIASQFRSHAVGEAHRGAPRSALLVQWEAIARIPYHEHRDEAKRMVEGYKALIAEDAAWKEPPAETLGRMTTEQQVAYWLHHLRDADAGQTSSPGECDVLRTYSRRNADKPNPAAELQKLGIAAVPQLIAHLDDVRPTRCEGFWRWYWPDSYCLLCYGDCCQQIFESVTGHSIYDRRDTNGYPIKDGKAKECRARAEQWWRDYQRKGERQMLIEGVAAGDRDSPRQLERLLAKYPQAALEPIVQGVRRSTDLWVRRTLLRSARQFENDEAAALFQEETRGPYRSTRVAAARTLIERGRAEGVQAVMTEWNRIKWDEQEHSDEAQAIRDVVGCLARCGEPAAVVALSKDFSEKPRAVRAEIVAALGHERDVRGRQLSPAVQQVAEELLAAALTDSDEAEEGALGPHDKQAFAATIADLAARSLTELWKTPALFDLYASVTARERQRTQVRNVWLRKTGKEPLPLPDLRRLDPAPDDKVQPLLTNVTSAKTPAERETALEALEQAGLPALPAIRRHLRTMNPDEPSQAALLAVAGRIALTIGEVRFDASSVPPTEDLRRRVEGLRGKQITADGLVSLLRDVPGDLPLAARGIRILLERTADDPGATLIAFLVRERPQRRGFAPQLSRRERIVIDGKEVHSSLGGMADTGGQTVGLADINWELLRRELPSALQVRPDQYLLIDVGCQQER
jgi:hypothetical protein